MAKLAGGTNPSLSTLKRWSSRYGWRALASLHDQAITQRMSTDLLDAIRAQARKNSDIISIAKDNFYERVAIDTEMAGLCKKDRRRVLTPSVLDFVRLIKLERELKNDADNHVARTPFCGRTLTPN